MKRSQLILILLICCTARLLWCIAGWKTDVIESYENNISIVYQRSAYLVSFGYGYRQTAPDSPAFNDLMDEMGHILKNEDHSTVISTDGIRNFAQYPPGLSLISAAFFSITKIPIPFIMQILAVVADVIALLLLIKICLLFLPVKTVKIAGFLYALYPPVLAITSLMTPDSWMIFFIASLLYVYFFQYKKHPARSVLLFGVITGIAILFRPDFTFVTAFILLGDWISQKKFLVFLRNNIVIYCIAFLILLPWGLFNLKHNGHFTIFSTALGGTLVTGFAAYDDPLGLGPSDLDRVREANEAGIDAPFEHEGDEYFRKRFNDYVSQHPVYYLKTIALRTVSFVLPAYSWGVVQNNDMSYSQMRNDGSVVNNIPVIFKHYALNLFSAIFGLLGNIALLILWWKNKNNLLFNTILLITICIYLSHVFIYMTPAYVIPLVFFQIIALVEFTRSKLKRVANAS